MINGIDIYENSDIDWLTSYEQLQQRSLYFVFIKASEGSAVRDKLFLKHWSQCRQLGLLVGAYHFFRPLDPAAVQAQSFLNQCHLIDDSGSLPPVVDIEWCHAKDDPTEQWTQLPASQRIPQIKTYLATLENALGVKPIIYTALSFWKEFIFSEFSPADDLYFKAFPLWLVDLNNSNTAPEPWANALFVQDYFGITTDSDPYARLDHDRCNGSLKDLLNAAGPDLVFAKGYPHSPVIFEFQEKLHDTIPIHADGSFGPLTENAVRAFQTSHGLPATGIIDRQTWNAIL